MKSVFKFTALVLALLISAFLGYSFNKTDGNVLNNNKPQHTTEAVTYNSKRHLYFTPQENFVKYIGRSVYHDECLWFSMSGSGFEFITSSDKVDITFICDNAESLYNSHKPRVAVYVNGELYFDETLKQKEETFSFDISRHIGDKVVRVIKLSESMYSSCAVSKIAVYDNKDIAPTDKSDLKIEFIGDSITAGYGIDEENSYGAFSTETENFTKTYAYHTAEKLNADYSAIAFSGYGVLSGRSKTECVVPKYYEHAITNKEFDSPYPLYKWSFDKHQADVVVINLGVNDVSYCTTLIRKDSFIKEYKNFIGLIRWYNPQAHILCVLGEVNNSMYPQIELAVKEFTEETEDKKVYCETLDFEMRSYTSAIDGHPCAESHEIAAENLTNMILNILDGNFISSFEETTDDITEDSSESETTEYLL